MRKDILENKELILALIEKNASKQTICNALNCKHTTLDSYLKKMGIEYKGNMSGKGLPKPERYKSVTGYLYNGSSIQSHALKLKLIKEKIFEHECSRCKLSEWQGVPIPLELDHIDGEHHNNELENLRLLCPNCHALTDTYRAKNKRTVRSKKEIEKIISDIPEHEEVPKVEPKVKKPRIRKVHEIKTCKICSSEFSHDTKTDTGKGKYFCSDECYRKSMVKFEVTPEELKELIWKYPTSTVASMYGVSDKAIEKRCKKYNIDKPPRGYWMKKNNKAP